MKTIKELKKGCGKKYIADIREKTPEGVKFRIGMATCDGKGDLPYCEVCQALIQQQEDIINMLSEEFPDLPHEEDRRVFTEWKDRFKEKLIGGEE